MKNYLKKFDKAFKSNMLNFRELATAFIIAVIILGCSVLTGGTALLVALKVLIPLTIETHVSVGLLYALFGKELTSKGGR